MKCTNCGAVLAQDRDKNDPGAGVMLRNRGLVLKASGVAFVCPKCKGDVTPTKQERDTLILFLRAMS